MNTQPPAFQAPQKACPHCSAVSQTLDERCPNCGKKFKKRTLLKVLVAIAVVGMLFIAGCAALIGGAATEIDEELDKQQNQSAITQQQFKSLKMGTTQKQVEKKFGPPADSQEMESEISELDVESSMSCIYYNREGGSFGDMFQLCFDDGKLNSKNAY